jgi:serine/threonine-protein kinase RsbW
MLVTVNGDHPQAVAGSHCSVKLELLMRLPRQAPTVAIARNVLAKGLAMLGVDAECVEQIRLAVSEACSNVVEHALNADSYEAHVEVDDAECAISVRCAGAIVEPPIVPGMPEVAAARGRGIAIMRTVMDRVEFAPQPGGTTVRLVKRLATHADDLVVDDGHRHDPDD